MNRHGERPEEDLLGNSQNLSKAALLAQPAVTEKLSGAFPRRSSVAQTGSPRPLSGLGKGARGLSGIDKVGAGCVFRKLRTTDLELLRPPTVV